MSQHGSTRLDLNIIGGHKNPKGYTKQNNKMSKPTSYQLLKDTHKIVSDLRKENSERMQKIEDRIDILEDYKGKIVGMVSIISILVSGGVAWVWKKITSDV